MAAAASKRKKLLFQFKEDTFTTVSRETLSEMAKALGFNETQTLHFAVARLRNDIRRGANLGSGDGEEPYPALTFDQLFDIRSHAPKPQGKLVRKQSLF